MKVVGVRILNLYLNENDENNFEIEFIGEIGIQESVFNYKGGYIFKNKEIYDDMEAITQKIIDELGEEK